MKILVVGYGSIGKRHVNNLIKIKNLDILICTKNKEAEILSKQGIKIFKSISESLKEKPEIGIICNETSLHIKTAIRLAKNNCHLFIEKPISNSLKGLETISKLTKKKKLITMIGCDMRFDKCIKEIKKIIEHDELGNILSVQSDNGSYLPDWHPYENYQKSYASRKDLGGGVVLTAIHEIDYLYWFFGSVAEVISFTGQYSDLKMSVEDLSVSLIKFNNNVISELHLDYFQRPSTRSCKLVGTKGTLLWDDTSNEVKLYNNNTKKWSSKLKIDNYDWNQMYVEEMAYFLNCVKKRQKTFNSVEDGIKTLKIALSIKESSKIKKVKNV